MRKRIWLTVALLAIATTCGAAEGEKVFRASLDGPESLEAVGAKIHSCKFVEGKFGKGLNGKGSVVVPSKGILDMKEGTLGFWFRPNWEGINKKYGGRSFIRSFSKRGYTYDSLFVGVFQDSVYFFITDAKKRRFQVSAHKVIGGPEAPWKKGEWIYIGVAWKQATGEMAIYINGKKAASRKGTPIVQDPAQVSPNFSLTPGEINGTLDALFIAPTYDPALIKTEMEKAG